MVADFATQTLPHARGSDRPLIAVTISSGAGAVGSWDSAIPVGCPPNVWEAVRWKRAGKSGEKQKARVLVSILESGPGYSEQQLHQHLESRNLPFYYPPSQPSLAADRGTVIEEVMEEPIEEPELVTAEPTPVHQEAEEFTPDFADAPDFGDAPDFADAPGPIEEPIEVSPEIPAELSEEPEMDIQEPSWSSRG